MLPMSDRDAMQYSPLSLAFIGDCVYEQFVRTRLLLLANMPASKLHKLAVKKVCAEYQAQAVRKWIDEELLDDKELEVFKRGRNSSGISAPKHSTVSEYRIATGLECLFGYLYLTGKQERLEILFNSAWEISGDDLEI